MEVKKIDGISYAIYWETMAQGTSIHSDSGTLEPYDIETRIAVMGDETKDDD